MRNTSAAGILFIAVAAVTTRAASPANPHVWDPDVRAVAVFKNGKG